MNKKTIIIISALAIIFAVLFIFILQKQEDTIVVQDGDTILFEKTEGWGPCPPDSMCTQSTKLYYSGILVIEGETELQKQLSQVEVDNIIDKIESTKVMDKSCSALDVVDYSAEYRLNVGNQEKTIQFPGCEDELMEIEKLINL